MNSLALLSRRSLASSSPLPSQLWWSATMRTSPIFHPLKRSYHNNRSEPPIEIHDAIIIGGGPTGLLLSNLLSSYNIHSHLLFDKRPVQELLQHPQAHFINVRSMEILKAELPNVYEKVLKEMPSVDEWEGFHFGGSVFENDNDLGGRRMGRVIHPVREPLRVGQSGDAILVPKAKATANNGMSNGGADASHDSVANDDPRVSLCRPAHLAQNRFVSLLLQEASSQQSHSDFDEDEHDEEISNHLRYGEEVIRISEQTPSHGADRPPIITIHTSKGQSYHTRYLLAADGVHSFVRRHFDIPMLGDDSLQNLINVHFRTNASLSRLLMSRNNQAMLHFIYNSQLVGAFVCHDGNKGEWVLQIPFFPPFQTLEDDFDLKKVRDMIWAGLLGKVPTSSAPETYDINFEILSIRPWTMSSLVAQRYFNTNKNMALVGDAAHAFPPAGGFGMNTGLQDAHNIAWRIALLLHREERRSEMNSITDHDHGSPPPPSLVSSSTSTSLVIGNNIDNAILSKYDQERRPIATQNAALSVRNYQRTLRIAKACYLDAQHPQLLISMLNSPPMNLLTLETRSNMFRRLVRVAMMPLGSFISSSKSSSVHANHIEKNVRSILGNGGSLPLVFPRYELGFSYNYPINKDTATRITTEKETSASDDSDDSGGYFPTPQVGHRMPHVMVELLRVAPSSLGNNKDDNEGWAVLETLNHSQTTTADNKAADFIISDSSAINHVSLTDISSQLRRVHSYPFPVFTLLAVGPELTSSSTSRIAEEAVKCVMEKWNVPIILVNVLPAKPTNNNVDEHQKNNVQSTTDFHCGSESKGLDVLYTVDTHQALHQLLHEEKASPHESHSRKEDNQHQNNQTNNKNNNNVITDKNNALILVRPDGHIANISWIDDESRRVEEETQSTQIRQVIERGFQNALG